ncbi:zinc metalloprotease HtpX [Candidatus Falkowbacteria bacterium RIFOXYB2_FULL_38_15]|uniref:Protease HtpX homolog n=1 Tax=Candidatus Falkowbacteria bacterium RIFOXYA2_FULL_38_12 TaxID=1797993 RepID=A0A1F5S3Q9_9BACT|nr:MAG: zinc metalloprotease HtpX [Candidatus Falkowbacteria bacterium RIFOXYA2_FULL_38_12]OGF33568.1 MAG: zinc metalloprotease HtpX [Candidatus Falkowbacteria bacterium RIFOXYB2_FULL_38_15]OGF42589.1 MAG: zinc metalloprotease HtpX [Candidatus Falkowbacteria bacterium RIFOXYD2_FULL_39_16]
MYNQITANKRKSILLVGIFVVFIALLGWLLGEAGGYGYGGLIVAGGISLVMALFSYYGGDKVALITSGAKGPLKKEENPYIYRLVENLCITSGLPMPKIYIIPDPAPNAFATGRDPKHSSIALTTGLIESLENEELEGVIAHELSHIKNYDIRLMMIVIVLVGTVALLSDWFLRFRLFGGGRDNDNNQINKILIIIGIILAILSPLIAQLIKLAVSRKREFLADADGSLLTRYPEGLARALEKISNYKTPLKKANNAVAHLYISSPFGAKTKNSIHNLFSTHPPIEERIALLRKMA